jgi:hypothetical protein
MTTPQKAYPLEVTALLSEPRLAPLGPGTPVPGLKPQLAAIKLPPACMAGLWLYFDYLDESHTISQDLHTKEGSFWHAIMHRREPDAWNSKYWWRRVGSHPVLGQLREQTPSVGYEYRTPEEFVDFCERVRGTGSPAEELAQRVQLLEWQLLFGYCLQLM